MGKIYQLMKQGEHGVITNVIGASHYDGGYESFNDAVDAMLDAWERLPLQEQVSILQRGYCNEFGEDYMIAVGYYDEETGESLESMTLSEVCE